MVTRIAWYRMPARSRDRTSHARECLDERTKAAIVPVHLRARPWPPVGRLAGAAWLLMCGSLMCAPPRVAPVSHRGRPPAKPRRVRRTVCSSSGARDLFVGRHQPHDRLVTRGWRSARSPAWSPATARRPWSDVRMPGGGREWLPKPARLLLGRDAARRNDPRGCPRVRRGEVLGLNQEDLEEGAAHRCRSPWRRVAPVDHHVVALRLGGERRRRCAAPCPLLVGHRGDRGTSPQVAREMV